MIPSLVIKRSIKSAASFAKAGLGYERQSSGLVNIIAYHRVVADIDKAERDSIYGTVISANTFRRHCELLRRAYDVVSLETAMHFLDGNRRTARPMAVMTFDDGYLDFYEQAFPILSDLNLPATVFIPTNYIGRNRPLAHDRLFWLIKQSFEKSISLKTVFEQAGVPGTLELDISRSNQVLRLTDFLVHLPNELREKVIGVIERAIGYEFDDYPREHRLLTWDLVREMHGKGIRFGSHTSNHVVLTREEMPVAKAEIVDSKAELEQQIKGKVVSFAYPNGEYTSAIRELTSQAGYKIAVTTKTRKNRSGADPLTLGRVSLCEESTRGITGGYSDGVASLRLSA